jgi:response regulator RpfG family c-di-GMP phosphodiesterase
MDSEQPPPSNAMKRTTPAQLLELAIAKQQEGEPECGLLFCLKAINLAVSIGDRATQRRALNVASNCCLLGANYIDAIEYGLQSAALARELRRDDAMIAALVNVTAALAHIGQIEEAVQIALNVARAFENRIDCNEDARQLLTNAAGAYIIDHDYMEAMRASMRAINVDGEIRDEGSANARAIDELNWFVAAVAMDLPSTADARMKQIGAIAEAYPSKQNKLRVQFVEALHLHYANEMTDEAIAQLDALIEKTEGFSTIQTDCYQWLIRLCQHTQQVERVNRYRQALVDRQQAKQRKRVQRALGIPELLETRGTKLMFSTSNDWLKALVEKTTPVHVRSERTEKVLPHEQQAALERLSANAQILHDLTGKSIYRIAKLTSMLAQCAGFSLLQSRALELATRLYPIGVNAFPSEDVHPALAIATTIARGRNEHWDGHGDPLQLSGKEIPEAARIASIAIAYDEFTHQGTMKHTEAVRQIKLKTGREFDPELVALFLPLIERLHLQYGDTIDQFLAADAPQRDIGCKARQQLRDLVPGLALLDPA